MVAILASITARVTAVMQDSMEGKIMRRIVGVFTTKRDQPDKDGVTIEKCFEKMREIDERVAELTKVISYYKSRKAWQGKGMSMLDAANKYQTKKQLKDAVGKPLMYEETSLFGPEYVDDGIVHMVGPDAHRDRRWYAQVTMKDGKIEKVK